MRRFAVVLSILEGLFMLSDGLHAFITGRYFSPGGENAPWGALVAAAGIDPFSTPVKAALVLLGAAFLICAAAYAFYKRHGRFYLGAVAVLTLWYLPLGTLLSLVVLVSIAVSKPLQSELHSRE